MDSLADWFDLKGILASASFLISLISLYFTWLNRKLAMSQEERRVPHLILDLTSAFFKRSKLERGRQYAFHITVSNPTDTNNAISSAELAIAYLTTQGVELNVRLKANEPRAVGFVRGQEDSALSIPFSITAHTVVSGWLRFHLPGSISEAAEIESHRLILIDTHKQSSEISPSMIKEYLDETAV